MRISDKFDFAFVKKSEFPTREDKEIQWKCLELETNIPQLTSVFYDDSTIIDYDGRGLGNWRDFKEHLEKISLEQAEDEMMKSMGQRDFLRLKGTDKRQYEKTLKSAERIVRDEEMKIILMATKHTGDFFDTGKPYARIVIPYEFELHENIRSLVKQNWGKSMKAENKGYEVFDTFLKSIENHVDISYLQSAFVETQIN